MQNLIIGHMDYHDLNQLILAAQQGNQEATSSLMQYYAPLIRSSINKIYKVAKGHVLLEDLEQEADILFFKLLIDFKPQLSNFGYYIKINFFRNLLSNIKAELNISTVPLKEEYIDYNNVFDRIHIVNDLARAMNQLSDKQKLAIKLYYFKEMPQCDCANMMCVTQPAFSRLLNRSTKTLKKIMNM